MRLGAALLLSFMTCLPLAHASYTYTECSDKYRARYDKDDDLKRFCYARMACSGIAQDMTRLACLARNNKKDDLADCIKRFNCTESACLSAAAFSCAGTCDKGQDRLAGRRNCARRDGVKIVTDLSPCPDGFKENLESGRCDRVAGQTPPYSAPQRNVGPSAATQLPPGHSQ